MVLYFSNGTEVVLSSTGILTRFNVYTTYYVANKSGNTFNLVYVVGGTTLLTTGSGTHYVVEKQVSLVQEVVTDPYF
jgi:hypothetical protein